MNKSKIVYLCGSIRFLKEFQEANFRETLNGKIVLSIDNFLKTYSKDELGKIKNELAELKYILDQYKAGKISTNKTLECINLLNNLNNL